MKSLTVLCCIIIVFHALSLEKAMVQAAQPFHEFCVRNSPPSKYRIWYEGIVCGRNVPASSEKDHLIKSGLIHLIVVSGSHLVFVDSFVSLIFKRFPFSGFFRLFALLCFTLISNLQPPVTRALIQRLLHSYLILDQRRIPSLHLQLLSGLLTLAFFPDWATSLSFIMSWFCALALSLPIPTESIIVRSSLVYLLMSPVMLNLGGSDPLSILYNVVFAPLLGVILFPLSLTAFLHPLFAYVCDYGWTLLFSVLDQLPLPETQPGLLFSTVWLLVYLFLTQLSALHYFIKSKRLLWRES